MKKIVLSLYLLATVVAAWAYRPDVTFVSPLNIPLVLSANFGELRSNHFHSGLDFKTQGRTGLPVFAADSGYVSRIAVSPWGYGHALYITHPSGYTTVYGHLLSFAPFIADRVREMQYERESFAIDTLLAPGAIPVSRGMRVATSGNTGSSGGPHLHFEVRHTESESPLDPLPWFARKIKDNIAPEPRQLALYPHDGVVDGKHRKAVRSLQAQGGNVYTTAAFTAWGEVSVGIKAYDRMSGTSNIYGVRSVKCWMEDSLLYESLVDSITFAETRYVNSLIDYDELRSNNGSTIMRTYIAPGNRLSTIYGEVANRGIFVIDEARTYRGRFELTDYYGNRSTVRFTIKGTPGETTPPAATGELFAYDRANSCETDDMRFSLPEGALYEDIAFTHSAEESSRYYSALHKLHKPTVPLHTWGELALKLTCDTLPDSCYYMVYIRNGRKSPVVGRYDAGWYVARVRDLGTYAVAADTVPPTITPLNSAKWGANGVVSLKITDAGSGIASYRGEIDGMFCLFEYDAKRSRLTCRLKNTPLTRGSSHHLVMTVTDMCGNRKVLKRTFTW